jgi:hypothetical protein
VHFDSKLGFPVYFEIPATSATSPRRNGEIVMMEKMTLERLGAVYANYLKVGQNAFEFLFDFGQIYLEDDDAQFHTRIITTPIYAKAFFRVLQDCINLYEQEFGQIPDEMASEGPRINDG